MRMLRDAQSKHDALIREQVTKAARAGSEDARRRCLQEVKTILQSIRPEVLPDRATAGETRAAVRGGSAEDACDAPAHNR